MKTETECEGLRLSDGVCVAEVVKRGTVREGCPRELGMGRQAQEGEGDAGLLECLVLTLTLNGIRSHRAILSREVTGPDIML